MNSFVVVIPARFESQRLPGKMLAHIGNKPLILHTVEQVRRSQAAQIIVATDDRRIEKVCLEANVDVAMTASSHQSGTDRIAEVAAQMNWSDQQVVINVQGDEPFLPFQNIDQVAQLMFAGDVDMATLATPVVTAKELNDPNCVKVVIDKNGLAMYFSRSVLPFNRDGEGESQGMRHIGIYGFTAASAIKFSQLTPCQLERLEKLEQLRALWHGWKISVGVARQIPASGVDTAEDLQAAREYYCE